MARPVESLLKRARIAEFNRASSLASMDATLCGFQESALLSAHSSAILV